MGQDIIVKQIRAGQTLIPMIPVRKQNMAWKQAADMGGGSPYDSFWFRTEQGVGLLDIQRNDVLQDINTQEQYLVFGRPETFDQSYIKIPAEQVTGT